MTKNRRNYHILTLTNAVGAMFGGFSVPFFLVFFFELGDASVLGMAIAAQGIAAAVASYYAGRYVDSWGRKPIMIWSSVFAGLVVMLYSLVANVWHLIVLQGLIGIITAMYTVAEQVFLADITEKNSRGRDTGRYIMILGVIMAVSSLIGGFFVNTISFKAIFIIFGVIFILDTIPLFWLEE